MEAPITARQSAIAFAILALTFVTTFSGRLDAAEYQGSIQMKPVKDSPNSFRGVRFSFDESFDVSKRKLKVTNEHLSITPRIAIDVRWMNERTLEFLWQKSPNPETAIAITLKKIPLKSGVVSFQGKDQGPYELKTPGLTLETAALQHNQGSPVVDITWNYPVSADQFRRSLIARHLVDGKPRRLRSNQIVSIQPSSIKSRSHTITIADPALWRGYLALEMTKPIKLGTKSYPIGRLPRLRLGRTYPMQINWTSTQETGTQFSVTVYCEAQRPTGTYYEKRNCRLDEGAADFIMVDPQVDFAIIPHYDHFQLVGAFQPNTNYRFTFMPGLRSGDATISAPITKTVQTPDLNAKFRFTGKARYLPEGTEPVLVYEATNIDKAKFRVRRVLPQNIVYWLTQPTEEATQNVSELVYEQETSLKGRRNAAALGKFTIPKVKMADAGDGIFAVEALDQYDSVLDRAVFVRTDIAAVVKQDQDDIVVWTRSLKDMSLKGSVNVEVYGFANQKIASCNTGLFSGECRLTGVMTQKEKPYVLLMKSSRDTTYMRFDDLQIDDQRIHAGTRDYPNANQPVSGYIYTSRGVYRPGEKVNLGAVLQTTTNAAATDTPVRWQIQNARGKVIKEVASRTGDFGMTELELSLAGAAPTGRWQADVFMGDKSVAKADFLVEDFVPERIGLEVKPKAKRTLRDNARFDLDAKYLFGPPVAGGDYKVNCSLTPAWDSIPGRADFKTGTHKRKKYLSVNLDTVAGQLDAKGEARVSCDYGNYMDSFPSVMAVTAQVEVAEAGSGRVTQKSATTLVARSKNIIGLKDLDSNGQQISVEGRIFNLKGEENNRYQGQVTVEVFQLQRHWIYGHDEKYGYSRWHDQEILVAEGSPQTVKVNAGKFSLAMSPSRDYGGYLIRATDKNGDTMADLEVSLGFRWYWWDYYGEDADSEDRHKTPKPTAPDEIRLNLSQREANPGDSLNLEFEAPFAGYGLLTTETGKLEQSQWITVKKGPQTVNVTVPDRLPNAYFSLLILKNPTEGGRFIPARAWGAASVKISPKAYDLAPKLVAPKKVRPGEDFTIELQTANQKPGAFTVAVVDEGILQLTHFKSPNPLDYFFEPRRLGVKTYDTVGWAFSDQTPSGKTTGGGGDYGAAADGGGGGRVSPVQIVSLWQGVTKTDSNGKATITLKTPPFQGSVRVMAVAASQQGTGAAEANIRVRDPLVVQATLPRFFSIEDVVKVPVRVSNMTGQKRRIRVSLEASSQIKLLGDTEKSVELNKDKSQTFFFEARVEAMSGVAEIKAIAQAGKIFTTVQPFTIPIVPQTPMVVAETTVPLQASVNLGDLIPDHMVAAGSDLDIVVSNAPYLDAMNQFAHLITYPYGCIEQTTSSTFPLLAMGNLIEWIDSNKSTAEVDEMVVHGINRILSMQTSSGGFGYWPGSPGPDFWGTVYATHMLLTAKDKGYSIAPSALEGALSYIDDQIETSGRKKNYRRRTIPYALYVLAKGGKVKRGRILNLARDLPDWGEQQLENQFLILASLYKVGDDRMVQKFLNNKTLLKPAAMGPQQHKGTYWSAFRSDAMRLALAEEIWPGDKRWDKIATRVARYVKGKTYLSTQERNWAMLGLGRRLEGMSLEPVGPVEMTFRGQQVAAGKLPDGSPRWRIANFDGKKAQLNFSFQSKGTPYVYAKVRGYAKDYKLPDSKEGLMTVSRRYLDLTGEPMGQSITQGDLVVVEMRVTSNTSDSLENAAVVDRIPAGFEIENPRLGRGQTLAWLDPDSVWQPSYVDMRDDQIQLFGDITGTHTFYYVARAVTPGDFLAPPASAEQMYDPERIAYSPYKRVQVVGD